MHPPVIPLLIPLLALTACDGKGDGGATTPGTNPTPEPDIAVSVSGLDFGETSPGEPVSLTVSVENRGDADLTVSALSAGTPYTLIPGTGFTILPDSTPISVTVQCAPADYSVLAFPDTLTISSDDPDEPTVSIPLSCDVLTDADGDGYDTVDAIGIKGDDCDDGDPSVHPGAEETWYDGTDSDCSGGSDYDADGDNFEASVYNSDSKAGGGDCQDSNAAIYPDAKDDWYDGIDSNCDGANDYDQDGDGYSSQDEGFGSDCDDTNPDINAANEEVFNGADDDCDGAADDDVPGWNADAVWSGDAAGDAAGTSFTTGDLNSDGLADIIIGAPGAGSGSGAVGVFSGAALPADGATIADGQNHFVATADGELGTTVGYFTDFKNSTGSPAVLLGAPAEGSSAGTIYAIDAGDLFYGGDTSDAFFTLSGTSSGQYIGRGFSQDLDLNADGAEDLVGLYRDGSDNAAYLLYGGVQGDYLLDEVDADWGTTGGHSSAWWSVAAGGDLNGDGYDDFVHCDAQAGEGGQVWVLWGQAERYSTLGEDLGADATVVVSGESNQQVGRVCGIGPDADGDGAEELWFQVPDASGEISGIYELAGGSELEAGDIDVSDSSQYRRYYEMRASDPGAITFGRIGDWDDDGIGDVAFGLLQSGLDQGRVLALGSADAAGDYSATTDAIGSAEGDTAQYQSHYGYQLNPFPVDLDADGDHDFIATDYGYDTGGTAAGAGALFMSYQLP